MTEYETAIMRDIQKMLLPICVGVLIAMIALFSIMPLNGIYHSLEWEMEQFDRGFTWDDKQPNGCFEREGGVTFISNEWPDYGEEVTISSACSSNALPWNQIVWLIPLVVILGILVTINIKFESFFNLVTPEKWKNKRKKNNK